MLRRLARLGGLGGVGISWLLASARFLTVAVQWVQLMLLFSIPYEGTGVVGGRVVRGLAGGGLECAGAGV